VAVAYRCVDYSSRQNASDLVDPLEKARFLGDFNSQLTSALGLGTLGDRFDAARRDAFGRLRRWRVREPSPC
jgi:hypothetical protein